MRPIGDFLAALDDVFDHDGLQVIARCKEALQIADNETAEPALERHWKRLLQLAEDRQAQRLKDANWYQTQMFNRPLAQ
jgi:hypothetical protein